MICKPAGTCLIAGPCAHGGSGACCHPADNKEAAPRPRRTSTFVCAPGQNASDISRTRGQALWPAPQTCRQIEGPLRRLGEKRDEAARLRRTPRALPGRGDRQSGRSPLACKPIGRLLLRLSGMRAEGPHLTKLPRIARGRGNGPCVRFFALLEGAGTGNPAGPRWLADSKRRSGLAKMKSETGLRALRRTPRLPPGRGERHTGRSPVACKQKMCASPWPEARRGCAPAQDASGSLRGPAIRPVPAVLQAEHDSCFA